MKAWTAVLFDNDDNKYREIAIRVLVSLLRTILSTSHKNQSIKLKKIVAISIDARIIP